jgi:glucose/arabinose dehydrogenase
MHWFLPARFAPALVALLAAPAAAQILPDGFVAEPIGAGWQSPVGLCFLDEQRLLVAERDGRVWFVQDGLRRNLVYDIASETLVNGDRGLLGITVQPDFGPGGGWLYLLLVVDTHGGGDTAPLGFSRLIRVLTEYEADGDLVAQPATREHLLGDRWSTGIPSCHLSHTVGSLHFLSDGSLVTTTGDNAHYDATDAGGLDPACFSANRTSPDQDVGSYRSQYDHTLCGKVLRLDPETGRGLPDNPFYTGDPDALLSRVWARGLRNPFRTTLVPGTGPREALFIADVGWDSWEEINLSFGGENFGWPCFEGEYPQSDYQDADEHGLCVGVDAAHVRPELAWHHGEGQAGFRGNCASGLCVYTGTLYPEVYRGRLFFSDFGRSWIRAARLDEELAIESSLGFAQEMNGPVDLVAQPGTGDLVYASISHGVFRLRYLGQARPPHAVLSATPTFGPGDLDVHLSARESFDPDGQPLLYSWDLGDGVPRNEPEFQHLFTGAVDHVARLTVTDSEGLTATAEVRITPHDLPPTIEAILAPLDGGRFASDEPLVLEARASDPEDGVPAARWALDLVHGHHVHPDWATAMGLATTLTPEAHGPGDNHFRLRLVVTDARGVRAERGLTLYDRHSQPEAHLVELAATRVRVGQRIVPLGHVDYALGQVTPKQATLTFDWGDGTQDVFPAARHHVDARPSHVYRRPGRYKLRLIASLEDSAHEVSSEIEVAPARPSVAVSAPLEVERLVARAEQLALVAALSSGLAGRAAEVRPFGLGRGADLAAWMDSLVDDPLADVLVLLDFVPEPLVATGSPSDPLERWIAGGNCVVWTGATPFLNRLREDALVEVVPGGVARFFGTADGSVVEGTGLQIPTDLGARVLPSLRGYRTSRALRYDLLGPAWSVLRIFAEDDDLDSDALELRHASGGDYVHLLCDAGAVARPAVLTEYLRNRLEARASSGPRPRPR